MKTRILSLVLAAVLLAWAGEAFAGSNAIPFTQEDRDRIIRIEATLTTFMQQQDKRFEQVDKRFEQVDKRFEQVDKRFEQVDKRFEQMMQFLQILAAIFTSLVLAVLGYAWWDRRTIIRKAKDDTIAVIEKEGRVKDLIYALRELAKSDTRLASILRQFNLL